MKTMKIRPISICLFRNDDSILVFEGYDQQANRHYYRPIGGGIEYGEHSTQALIREVKEEINEDIYDVKLLDVVENIFTYNGQPGHEVVFVYDAKFQDKTLYNKPTFCGIEDNGDEFKLVWVKIEDCINKTIHLVPEELISILSGNGEVKQ